MSAGSKAGLIFLMPQAIVAIGAVILALVPAVVTSQGPSGLLLCCATPIASLLLAVAAGYFATQWHDHSDNVTNQGLTAGLISGCGALAGALLFWIACGIFVAYFANDSLMQAAIEQAQKIQPGTPVDAAMWQAVTGMLIFVMTIIGLITGTIALGFSLLGGVIGANVAQSMRSR